MGWRCRPKECQSRGAGTWTRRRRGASSASRRRGPGSTATCRHTGCATPTPATPWSAARRSPWCAIRLGTQASAPRTAICTRGRTIARRGIWRSEPKGHLADFRFVVHASVWGQKADLPAAMSDFMPIPSVLPMTADLTPKTRLRRLLTLNGSHE